MEKDSKKIICKDVHGKEYEIAVGQLSFRPSVYGVIIQDGKAFLSKQWGDGYDFPGGGIELGETIEEALKREVKEETGLEVKVGEIIAVENSFLKFNLTEDMFNQYLCTMPAKWSAEKYQQNFLMLTKRNTQISRSGLVLMK